MARTPIPPSNQLHLSIKRKQRIDYRTRTTARHGWPSTSSKKSNIPRNINGNAALTMSIVRCFPWIPLYYPFHAFFFVAGLYPLSFFALSMPFYIALNFLRPCSSGFNLNSVVLYKSFPALWDLSVVFNNFLYSMSFGKYGKYTKCMIAWEDINDTKYSCCFDEIHWAQQNYIYNDRNYILRATELSEKKYVRWNRCTTCSCKLRCFTWCFL